MGDTQETVANQATEVIEVDKLDEQQPMGEEKEVKKRKAMAPRSETAVCCALTLLCYQPLNLVLVLIVAWLKCLNIA